MNPQVLTLLTTLGFETYAPSRKGFIYYRPMNEGHLSIVIELGPQSTVHDVTDAILDAGRLSQAGHISRSFRSLLLDLQMRDHPPSDQLAHLLSQPVHARHAILSMGPLLDLERCLWPQASATPH